ncbi:MAG: MBL fold metallo-hydrolase, partial [Sphaerochaetaceae bacterium]|nr:MBL fold metallo-hydrolase [Sphaerochaetaceae bacterium]
MLNSENIKYIGCNDHETDLFEGQYIIPNGMAYNSYVILDEKVAVMDTMDKHCTSQWLENLQNALGGRNPDFLIVQHMEPDHSASIKTFLEKYPETTVVGSRQAFVMMDNFFGKGIVTKNLVVGDKDTLSLGKHNLTFVTAPMVHWPEVILTYESTEKVLFSADAFGKFGALDVEEEDWDCEA